MNIIRIIEFFIIKIFRINIIVNVINFFVINVLYCNFVVVIR